MSFLRRVDLLAEIVYKSKTKFRRIQNTSSAMSPRLPPHSTVTIKTDVTRFYVGDVVALCNPNDRAAPLLLREVTAGPGSLIEGPAQQNVTLHENEYWVVSRQPHSIDSQSFGPITSSEHIMGRAVHCSTMQHWIHNSITAQLEDREKQWIVPLSPQTIADLSTLWSKTTDFNFLSSVLPLDHRARPPPMEDSSMY
jgi:hypothetical protein